MKKTQVELESRIIQGPHGVAQEEDHIVMSKVVGVGVAALLFFTLGGMATYFLIQVPTEKEMAPDGVTIPAVLGQYEIGIVNQRLFEQDTHAEAKIASQQNALVKGWGDKPGMVAHPTLEQAMQTVITQEQQARQQQQPQQPPAPAPAPGQ